MKTTLKFCEIQKARTSERQFLLFEKKTHLKTAVTKLKNKQTIFKKKLPNCNGCTVAIVTGHIPRIRKTDGKN